MEQEQLDMAIRRFLKQVGITSHQELESLIAKALAEGCVKPGQTLQVSMTLDLPELAHSHRFDGALKLGDKSED